MKARSLSALAMSLVIAGCTHISWGKAMHSSCPGPEASDEALFEIVRDESLSWLRLVSFEPSASEGAVAVLSYPGGPDELKGRTYLYDQALALLWFAWTGDQARARGLAKTLIDLQGRDGAWGFSFEPIEGGFYDTGYVRTGAVAWAGWALAFHSQTFGDDEALDAARKVLVFIETRQVHDPDAPHLGLHRAGLGHHNPRTGERTLGVPVDFAVTEHQLDVHMLLRALDESRADTLARQIHHTLWLEAEDRFAVGANANGLDLRRALDAAGGWGALWLLSIGEEEFAQRSLAYTLKHFAAEEEARAGGFVPYLDPLDGYDPASRVIFVEGSLGLGLAALRLGHPRQAEEILRFAAKLGCTRGPGIPYADRHDPIFIAIPAAAPTLWFLFLERELATGEVAPLFRPLQIHPLSQTAEES